MDIIRYASDVIEYDRRTPELSNAALHMKLDVDCIEKKRPLNPWNLDSPRKYRVDAMIKPLLLPSASAIWKTTMLPIMAPNTPKEVMIPCRLELSLTVSDQDTPESELSFSCTSTALVAPISYPNNSPPRANI